MTAAPTISGYTTEPAILNEHGKSILALWRQGLAHTTRLEAKFDWYYRHNPEGAPLMSFLLRREDGERVGIASAAPRRMHYRMQTLRAGSMIDFVVAPAHRTLFPALYLQKTLCRQALEVNSLLYGLASEQWTAAVQRVGYRPVGQLVRRVRVLRSAPYLSRLLPSPLSRLAGAVIDRVRMGIVELQRLVAAGFRSEWQDRPDARFDELWARALDPNLLTGTRDRAFLDWRFAGCPLHVHRFFTVASTGHGGLVAYAVCESQQRSMLVRDFLVDLAFPGAWARLWSDLIRAAFDQGHTSIALEFLGPDHLQHRLAAKGFVAREQQRWYAMVPANLAELSDGRRWYITEADMDV